jgi:hypothetical protein
MSIALKIMGVWLFFDGFVSLIAVKDKRRIYQIIRIVRAIIGVILVFI